MIEAISHSSSSYSGKDVEYSNVEPNNSTGQTDIMFFTENSFEEEEDPNDLTWLYG